MCGGQRKTECKDRAGSWPFCWVDLTTSSQDALASPTNAEVTGKLMTPRLTFFCLFNMDAWYSN